MTCGESILLLLVTRFLGSAGIAERPGGRQMRVLLIDCEGIDVRCGRRRADHANCANLDDDALRAAAVLVLGPGVVAEGDPRVISRRLDVAGGMVLLVSPAQSVIRKEQWESMRVGRFIGPEDVAREVLAVLTERPVPWPSPREWMVDRFDRIEHDDATRAVIRAARSLEEFRVPVWAADCDLSDAALRETLRTRVLILPRAALCQLRLGVARAQIDAGAPQRTVAGRGLYSSQQAVSRALRRFRRP